MTTKEFSIVFKHFLLIIVKELLPTPKMYLAVSLA